MVGPKRTRSGGSRYRQGSGASFVVRPMLKAESTPTEKKLGPDDVKDYESASRYHAQRTLKARQTDEAMAARVTDAVEEWAFQPNRRDLVGIDLFPIGSFKSGLKRDDATFFIRETMKAFTGKDFGRKIVFYDSKKSPDPEEPDFEGNSLAYHSAKTGNVYIGPEATKAFETARTKKTYEAFESVHTVAHELFHAAGRSILPRWAEEGGADMLAAQYVFSNFKMGDEVKAGLKSKFSETKGRFELPSNPIGYYHYVEGLASLALIINDGDKQKAVNWILKEKTAMPDKSDEFETREWHRKAYEHRKAVAEELQKKIYSYVWENTDDKMLLTLMWGAAGLTNSGECKKRAEMGEVPSTEQFKTAMKEYFSLSYDPVKFFYSWAGSPQIFWRSEPFNDFVMLMSYIAHKKYGVNETWWYDYVPTNAQRYYKSI